MPSAGRTRVEGISPTSPQNQFEQTERALLRMLQQSQNVSLVGPAGCGKTHLLASIARNPSLNIPDGPLPVYLDCRPLAHATQEECLACLAEALIHALRRAGSSEDSGQGGSRIADLVSGHLLAVLGKPIFCGVRVCYALDHFEYAAWNTRLSVPFFSALRSLCSQPDISIVCATRIPLWQFARLVSLATSSFPNVFLTWGMSVGERVSETGCPSQHSSD